MVVSWTVDRGPMPPHCCPSKVPRQGTPFPPPASRGTSSPASMVLWSAPIPVRPTRRPSFPSRDGDHPLRLCSSLHPSPAPTWGQGFSGLATPRQPVLEEMATYGRPKFLGNPCVPMPCSLTPAGPQQQAVTLLRHGPRSQHDEGYPRCGNFGAQWHGLGTCCLRFARWIARRGRKTRCWLLARLYQTGFAPAGFLRKVSVTTPASLPPFPSFLGAGRVPFSRPPQSQSGNKMRLPLFLPNNLHSDSTSVFLGRPRGRSVACNPNCSAVLATQASAPNGVPRLTLRRNASNSPMSASLTD